MKKVTKIKSFALRKPETSLRLDEELQCGNNLFTIATRVKHSRVCTGAKVQIATGFVSVK